MERIRPGLVQGTFRRREHVWDTWNLICEAAQRQLNMVLSATAVRVRDLTYTVCDGQEPMHSTCCMRRGREDKSVDGYGVHVVRNARLGVSVGDGVIDS